MLDFLMVSTRALKRGTIEIYPRFIIKKSSDLMIRGGDFYAIWNEDKGLWSTEEQDALQLIDQELDKYAKENEKNFESNYKILHMWDAESGMIDHWHKYCQKQLRDNFHMLDERLIFENYETDKKDYASKRLNYPLEKGSIKAWDRLLSVLYSEEERHKIEWSIGSIVSGESKQIQKFVVLYGSAGTGKSTILNIVQKLFHGYYSVFDAKALGSSNNSFALEAFKNNPLVAIQHDGDLSRIEDNTRLNSLVSHELMTVNEKFRSTYANQFKCFLFMGTNKPVKITDAKSGLIRRLIDISPTGEKIPGGEYRTIMKQIDFELGAIAYHCLEVYRENPDYYDNYIPIAMLSASNDFYNFVLDSYFVFKAEDMTTLKSAWEMYKTYVEDANVNYPLTKRIFKEELKNYFNEYKERHCMEDGSRVRSCYIGFRFDKFEDQDEPTVKVEQPLIKFDDISSVFDEECKDCPAQYANDEGTPNSKWINVKTSLKDLDTNKLHYVKVPENHIVIDFDIPDENGNKDFEKNLKAASKWPETYAELSKSGAGIHLHYIYKGDVSKLSRVYDDYIEVKIFTGLSSLRRKYTKSNGKPIATISSGLPLKGEETVINNKTVTNEKGIRTMIKRNLNKEIHPGTKPSIDFINKILEDAYNNGVVYDVEDLKGPLINFAANSTHQAPYCLKLVSNMKFKSEVEPDDIPGEPSDADLVFYDIEVFPNLLLVNYKKIGKDIPVTRLINPTPTEIENLIKYNLIGFNCRRYDNHILYARLMGWDNLQIYNLSQRIISGDRSAMFGAAYNISYTDVYDFASAGNKKSLKKLEIEMGIHHQELGLPWDEPVDESLWPKVAEYCDNDVLATEAAFLYLKADWTARQILADLADGSVNDSTNSLTTKIIFGNNKNPQNEFNYRNLAEPVRDIPDSLNNFLTKACPKMMAEPHGTEQSVLPYFPGYKYDHGTSTYRDELVGEGGYVCTQEGIHRNVALLDVSSMHPHSLIAEALFGVRYTEAFRDIVEGRVSIKHEAWNEVDKMLDGKLRPYIEKVKAGNDITSKDLANALKTAINSVYGLTSASFNNAFLDPRNKDNIVAKRGALFMIDLKNEVQARGFTVAHIKTDSIKIPDATNDIIEFVMEFGERYGYTFEHEATYEKMCLVNKAVYVAKYATVEKCEELYGKDYLHAAKDICKDNKKHGGEWTATGTQFAVPFVFKTLFSHEPLVFEDFCETKSVSTVLYLDLNESLPDVSEQEAQSDKLKSKYRSLLKDNKKRGVEDTSILDNLKVDILDLEYPISQGHNYHFVGKVGLFTPIKKGAGGGILSREGKDDITGNPKYSAPPGTDGYRWLESEMVKQSNKENDIDKSYYNKMVDDAVETISQYGDFEEFIA